METDTVQTTSPFATYSPGANLVTLDITDQTNYIDKTLLIELFVTVCSTSAVCTDIKIDQWSIVFINGAPADCTAAVLDPVT